MKTVPHFTKLCTVNMRSVRNNISAFTDFALENDFDIIAIWETWLRDGDNVVISRITHNGYIFQHRPREEKTGGGVGLLFESSLSITVQQVTPYRSFECLHVMVTSDSRSVRLIIIYRPEVSDNQGRHLPFHLAYSLMSLA